MNMSSLGTIDKENGASSATCGDCMLHDWKCFHHAQDHPLAKPRKQSLIDRDPSIAVELGEGASVSAAGEASFGASAVLAVWTCGRDVPNARHLSHEPMCAAELVGS
jgi:hypothetical protein